MSRMIHKQWKDRPAMFKYRVRWYEVSRGEDIRLSIETPDGERNLFPTTEAVATALWVHFKREAKKCALDLLDNMRTKLAELENPAMFYAHMEDLVSVYCGPFRTKEECATYVVTPGIHGCAIYRGTVQRPEIPPNAVIMDPTVTVE